MILRRDSTWTFSAKRERRRSSSRSAAFLPFCAESELDDRESEPADFDFELWRESELFMVFLDFAVQGLYGSQMADLSKNLKNLFQRQTQVYFRASESLVP